MVEIILVRHGETAWNTGGIFRGRVDVPLSEAGLEMAEKLGEYLNSEKIDIIYASPLQRAVRTAAPLAGQLGLEVHQVEDLIDINYGEWQGLGDGEVREKYPELHRGWLETPEQVRIPGGETLEEVRGRALPFLREAVAGCGDGKLTIVSHRVVNKVLICALLGLENSSFWNIKVDTGGITRFVFDGDRAILTVHNDTSYQGRTGAPPRDF
jgi:broad specificity phosphatase PhoE